MKTSLRRASKRTLALLLGVLMLITTAGIGTLFTANAVTTATTYYLWYNNSGTNGLTNFKSMAQLSTSDGNYYTGQIPSKQSTNVYFIINTDSSAHTTSVFSKSNLTTEKKGSIGWVQSNTQDGQTTCEVYLGEGTIYVGYDVKANKITVSSNKDDIGGGGTGGGGDTEFHGPYYYRGDGYQNSAGEKWKSQIMTQTKDEKTWYLHVNAGNFRIFKDNNDSNWDKSNCYDNAHIKNSLGNINLTKTGGDDQDNSINLPQAGYVCIVDATKDIYATTKNPDGETTPTTPATHEYTVGVATNYSNATVTATVKGGSSVSNTTESLKKIEKVEEGSEVTFTAKASDNNKEFKGWFTTADPKTTGNSGKGYNAVSMDETFKIELRSDVEIYALYSDSQDEENGGIVSGAVYYYSAPEVSIDILDKSGTTILKDNNGKASVGDTITVKAKITKEAEYYINRVKPEDQKLQYLYNFYEIEKGGEWHLLDSQTGSAAVSSDDDPRLTCTTETTFSETSKYCVQAYCVYVDPDDSPFSYGVSQQVTVRSDTEVNTEKVKVYIDFNKHSPQSAAIVVTDANDIGRPYKLTKLGSDSSSNIYYADDVVVAYTTKENVNTMKSDFVSINVDGERVFIDDADQPELSSLLQHKILWYRANDDANMKTNITQTHYVVKDNMGTNYKNKDKFRPYTYRTQSNALSTKRIYLTNNTDNGPGWSSINVVYSLNKAVDMTKTGYSNEHNKYIWFQKAMNDPKGTNAQGQTVFYVDLPYNVTAFYFENGSTTSSDKAEVHYKNDLSSGGNGANNDFAEINEANAYYFDSTSTVRMWPDDDRPETPAVAEHISDLYIVKGQTLDITATLAKESKPSESKFSAEYVSNGTGIASVLTTSGRCTLTAREKGNATITIKTTGYVTKVKMDGISETINVTVIDKDELRNMIAEAEYIIGERNEGRLSEYTQNSYAAFETVYNVAIDVYNRSLYNQAEVDTYAALLREAMENLCTEDKVSSGDNQFDLIAYNTSDVKVISDGNGTVNNPTIKNYSHKVTGANGEVSVENVEIKPYITNVDNGYQIIYAEGFGFSCTASEAQSEHAFKFWTKNGDNISQEELLDVENVAAGETTYMANFDVSNYTLDLVYQFKDFDSNVAGTNEFVEGCLKKDYDNYTLQTTVTTDDLKAAQDAKTNEEIYGTSLNNLAINCTPNVVSSYYTYNYPEQENISDNYKLEVNDADKTAKLTITLGQEQRKYSVYVGATLVGSDYHYQQSVTLDASKYCSGGSDGQKYKWTLAEKDINMVAEGNDNILSLQKEYTIRVLEDKMRYNVELADEKDTIDKTSVISPAYTEAFYSDNTKRIQQNFYIQNNLENRDDLKGAGSFFYYWNDDKNRAVNNDVKSFYLENSTDMPSALEQLVTSNLDTWHNSAVSAGNHKYSGTVNGMNFTYYNKPENEDFTKGLLRYSTINSCWNYILAINSVANFEKYGNYSYRVHSFFVLKSGEVIVSKTYAQAKVYVDNI